MILSRIVPLASSAARSTLTGGRKMFSTSSVRSGGHAPMVYRQAPPQNSLHHRIADVFGAFMWWWIFWHCFTDYEHLIGHFEFPDARSWTDAELGIPPDDAEDPEIAPKEPQPSVFLFKKRKLGAPLD